ncbi:division/cell wall cluster transcriptional repressor MraZ [Rubritalea sp.]|uniref:division/cell wall cluster transcriptional repressor MraZ n=1 Tax=Rubritalea sp. TaxID=2109375 RepID=UPI003EF3B295
MTNYDHTLEGVFEHKLDPKCRVSVPSDWRVLAGSGVLRLLKANNYKLPVLKVLTEQEFANILQDIEQREGLTIAQRRALRGKLFSSCQKTKLNPQGKLLIPKALCSHPSVEPDGQVTLVGRGTYFEIVSPDNYEEMQVREEAEIAELNVDLDIF